MSGWGNALEQRTQRPPLGGQLPKWTTFTYYTCGRNELAARYVAETVRCDFGVGVYIVSACKRTWLSRLLDRWFSGILWWGRRELIEIHVRR